MIVKLLTEHHLEFLGLKGGCRGSSESTHVKIPFCRKSLALAQMALSLGMLEVGSTKLAEMMIGILLCRPYLLCCKVKIVS